MARKKTTKKFSKKVAPKATKKIDPTLEAKRRQFGQDLPDELLEQLTLRPARFRGLQGQLVQVLPTYGEPPISLNSIVIALWNEFQVVARRNSVTSGVNALIHKGIARRAGAGCYTLAEGLSRDDALELLQ